MSEKTAGADVRLFLQWTFLVLGAGVTLLNGWVLGGVGGTVIAGMLVFFFFLFLYFLKQQDKEKKGPTTGGIVWYVIYTAGALINLVTNN